MVKPQQPELRRSDLGATSDDAIKARLSAPHIPDTGGRSAGPVPEENLPGHHPEHDQDKPSGDEFVAKMHKLATEAEEAAEREEDGADVVELRQRDDGPSERADRLASLAGKPFEVVGGVLKGVRDRLPGG